MLISTHNLMLTARERENTREREGEIKYFRLPLKLCYCSFEGAYWVKHCALKRFRATLYYTTYDGLGARHMKPMFRKYEFPLKQILCHYPKNELGRLYDKQSL